MYKYSLGDSFVVKKQIHDGFKPINGRKSNRVAVVLMPDTMLTVLHPKLTNTNYGDGDCLVKLLNSKSEIVYMSVRVFKYHIISKYLNRIKI